MSMSINFFGSCFDEDNIKIPQCNYPFGMDPVWGDSNNKLQIYNSLKMKLSIIFGVSQMILGILIKGTNCLFFCNAIDFFFEFIP